MVVNQCLSNHCQIILSIILETCVPKNTKLGITVTQTLPQTREADSTTVYSCIHSTIIVQ